MYELAFDEEVIEFLEKLPESTRKRIFDKIVSSKVNPFFFFERLKGRRDFRMRIGDYRAIADIDSKKKVIQVTLVGHRKNIYKKLRR